jgi:hypothetical protein
MRIFPPAHASIGLLCSVLVFIAGCNNPSSQNLNSLTVSATPTTVAVGGASVLKATAHLSDGTSQDVTAGTTFTSSDATMASVTNSTLTAKAQGTVTIQAAYITVAPADGSSSSTAAPQNLSASMQITVTAPDSPTALNVPVITWAAPQAITAGTALSGTQLDATANVPGTFVYSPAAGVKPAAGTQTLSVTFTPTDTKTYSSATATVQLVVNAAGGGSPSIPVITWATPQAITAGTALSSTQLNATANVPGTFVYSPAAGEKLSAGTQTLSVTFTPTDTASYSSTTASVQLVVKPSAGGGSPTTPVITWATPQPITVGTALSSTQLNATANVAGTFVYSPAAGSKPPVGTQTLSVAFTPTDKTTYSSTTATVHLVVNAAVVKQTTPTITWATPASVVAGTKLSATQLNATASVAGTFAYSPGAGTVLSTGTQQLSATFTPNDTTDYTTATASVSLTVTAPPSNGGGTNPGGYKGPIQPTPTSCGGPTITLDPSMNTSTLQSKIAAAADCSMIVFSPGTYNITSQIWIPCPKTGLTITGPESTYPGPYAAVLNGSVANSWGFGFGSCSSNVTIEYLTWNGGEPAAGGGGFLYVSSNTSNLMVQFNVIYGNQANVNDGHEYDSLIWFDGNDSDPANLYDNNDTVQWNIFGHSKDGTAANGDCGAVSALYRYQGDVYDGTGGYCAAVALHSSTNNFTVANNVIQFQEQGAKFYEGGSAVNQQFYEKNLNFIYNDVSFIHRISVESQMTGGSPGMNFNYNSMHDQVNPAWGSWGVSIPQSGANNCIGNVMMANSKVPTNATAGPGAFEFWGTGVCNNNLIQGWWGAGVQWGWGSAPWQVSNNIIQQLANNAYTSNEENMTSNFPTFANNSDSQQVSAVTSAAPTISPSSGAIAGNTTVTLTDTGATSNGVGPQGNTTIYYTTDGSTPTTSSYVCNPTPGTTSCTITVSGGTTIKAIGMWGSLNQPKSYPTGYGFVPSAVVTASYTPAAVKAPSSRVQNASTSKDAVASPASGSLGAVQSVAIQSDAEVTIGGTTALKATATFSDGSVKDVTTAFQWQSSDPRTITVAPSGVLSGLASGTAVISGSYQGYTASVTATSSVGSVDWSPALVITHGGTYSGNWQSTDRAKPAVAVATREPVVIENAHLSSTGDLIKTTMAGVNLTVRNSVAVAVNAGVKGQANGIFLNADSAAHLDVENNYIENARGGVIIRGYSGTRDGQATIVIRANRARNLNGRLSNGNGGYLTAQGRGAHFIQLDSVQSVPGIDVGWNEVINYPGRSLVEDNIQVYRSSGTANQPLEIHDSYIQGAYPLAAQDAFNGGGIKTEAKAGDSAEQVPAFNNIYGNQVVGTVNYGIELTAGHDNVAANNRVIGSGLLPDGSKLSAQFVGMAAADVSGDAGTMYNNAVHDNVIGWACWQKACASAGYRNDQFYPASSADYSANSVISASQITREMENNEYQYWQTKTTAAGVAVGPAF